MSLYDLLENLQAEGVVDSAGAFTVSLAEARRKLKDFRSENPARFLTLIVSAGIAAGADSCVVRQDQFGTQIDFPGAYLAEEELVSGYQGLFSGQSSPRSQDLVLGFQDAFALDTQHIEVEIWHPTEPSYRWKIQPQQEESEPLPQQAEAFMQIRLVSQEKSLTNRVKSFFNRGGGYLEMSPESRMLDARAEHALIPISVNDNLVTRDIFLPESPASALVGELPSVHTSSPAVLTYAGSHWKAALALAEGKIVFVLRGLSYEYPKQMGLSGFVYCDELKLDLSHEQIVQDPVFQHLVDSLQELKSPMVLEALKSWSLVTENHQGELMNQLAELTSTGKPSLEQTREVLVELRQDISCREKLELLLLWARECELQGYPDKHWLISEHGYHIAEDRLRSVGLATKEVFAAAYFCEYGPHRIALPFWLVLACYTSARWNDHETEHWFKKTFKYFGSNIPDLLSVALESRLAFYFQDIALTRVAEQRFRMLRHSTDRLPEHQKLRIGAVPIGLPDRAAVDKLLLDYANQEPNIRALKL